MKRRHGKHAFVICTIVCQKSEPVHLPSNSHWLLFAQKYRQKMSHGWHTAMACPAHLRQTTHEIRTPDTCTCSSVWVIGRGKSLWPAASRTVREFLERHILPLSLTSAYRHHAPDTQFYPALCFKDEHFRILQKLVRLEGQNTGTAAQKGTPAGGSAYHHLQKSKDNCWEDLTAYEYSSNSSMNTLAAAFSYFRRLFTTDQSLVCRGVVRCRWTSCRWC